MQATPKVGWVNTFTLDAKCLRHFSTNKMGK